MYKSFMEDESGFSAFGWWIRGLKLRVVASGEENNRKAGGDAFEPAEPVPKKIAFAWIAAARRRCRVCASWQVVADFSFRALSR